MKRNHLLAISLLFACGGARAYETQTHAWIMHQGYLRSTLATPELRSRLGFNRLVDSQPFQIHFELPNLGSPDAYLDLPPNSTFGQSSDPYAHPEFHRPPTFYEQLQFVYTDGPAPPQSANGLFLDPLKVEAALVRGAVREDDLYHHSAGQDHRDADPHGDILRVMNHFYDPFLDRPLTLPPTGSSCVGLFTHCSKSVDWALGSDAFAPTFSPQQSRRNHFSWNDARENYWQALTFKSADTGASDYAYAQRLDSGIRKVFWNTSLKSIGHVAHLLQDTAQPQHTRNDRHNPHWIPLLATTEERQWMEHSANLRTLGNFVSDGRDSSRPNRNMRSGSTANSVTSPHIAGTYPIPVFATPLKFFTTRGEDALLENRRGLADYSNRGFYTEGTTPGRTTDYPSPPTDLNDPSFTLEDATTAVIPTYGTLVRRKLFREVPDLVASAHIDPCAVDGKMPLLTVSAIYDFESFSAAPIASAAMSADEYRCHQDALIPRAVAFSAGLIDHFFRGELEIEAPPQRVLAVVDQGIAHTVDADGYPRRNDNNDILGFEKVRLRVRNITPSIHESGSGNVFTQSLGGTNGPSSGRLVAVARYHRNPCYKPDLSGERRLTMPATGVVVPPSGCTAEGSRTGYEEISVSAELVVSPGEYGFGAGAAFVDRVFDFSSDAIPVNATDLFIQVVYRGPLGAEADGIALGTYDAREPMYVGFWNNADYLNNDGVWSSSTGSLIAYRKSVKSFQFCAGTQAERTVLIQYDGGVGAPAMGVPEPAGYMRFAVIGAKPVSTENIVLRGNPSFYDPAPPIVYEPPAIGVRGTINQANKERLGPGVSPYPLASAPQAACPSDPVGSSPFLWCVEPVLVRRGLAGGKVSQAIYLTNSFAPSPAPDAGVLPAFTQAPVQRSGINYWNTSLTPCPLMLTGWTFDLNEVLLLQEELVDL